jgi:hypothetical protein
MRQKITDEYIDIKLKDRPLKRISHYIDSSTTVDFECLKDGYIWKSKINDIFYGHGCPKCYHPFATLTLEEINKKLNNKNFVCLGKINKNGKSNYSFKCSVDNYEWTTSLHHVFNSESGCPKCAKQEKITNGIFDERIKNRNIIRIGECKNNFSKLALKCLLCDNIWEGVPSNVFNGSGS